MSYLANKLDRRPGHHEINLSTDLPAPKQMHSWENGRWGSRQVRHGVLAYLRSGSTRQELRPCKVATALPAVVRRLGDRCSRNALLTAVLTLARKLRGPALAKSLQHPTRTRRPWPSARRLTLGFWQARYFRPLSSHSAREPPERPVARKASASAQRFNTSRIFDSKCLRKASLGGQAPSQKKKMLNGKAQLD